MYIKQLDPMFVQHISRHRGQEIAIMTTAGKVEEVLAGIAADHMQLNLKDRAIHIRIS
ncbi:DUF2642 domain-containing protein [Paenibacillus qinlingensis]|uniref:DUF2642 domain-containing protein n=1 Tax=Paenibacillus qinlingensis TaxID=1837343 RepID=UPI002368DB76|nr:DUF2642 domain-containing protein [Paenibacillus qinlingensis]